MSKESYQHSQSVSLYIKQCIKAKVFLATFQALGETQYLVASKWKEVKLASFFSYFDYWLKDPVPLSLDRFQPTPSTYLN